MESQPIIKLKSSDGVIFPVSVNIAKCAKSLELMFENLGVGEEDESDDNAIPLAHVNAIILKKILQWAEHHKDDVQDSGERYDAAGVPSDEISDWDKKFIDLDQPVIFDLMVAANYLDIKGLLDLTSKAVARMIKGRLPHDIRNQFNIQNDFDPLEEDSMRKENEWLRGVKLDNKDHPVPLVVQCDQGFDEHDDV